MKGGGTIHRRSLPGEVMKHYQGFELEATSTDINQENLVGQANRSVLTKHIIRCLPGIEQ